MNTNFSMIDEFYPTPLALLEKITKGVDFGKVCTVLEPSAGKGDMADYVIDACAKANWRNQHEIDVDVIEKDPDLRNTLKGKELRVVGDDFLEYNSFKHYDLIIMNPPFSNGDEHLLKALDMQKYGGAIICILNAETLKNPFSAKRKSLVKRLEELNASIEYMREEFSYAERKTNVEIAVIKVDIPAAFEESEIIKSLRKKHYSELEQDNVTDIAINDFIEAAVTQYNIEIEAGIKLMREYNAMAPYIKNDFKSEYARPIIEMRVNNHDASINEYVKLVRMKYWTTLFKNPRFTGNMTTNQFSSYQSKVNELADYDFSIYNIKELQKEMSKKLVRGIEECILALFDELSHQYAWYDTSNNIHYYNGWKTNKAWIINKKVIIPFYYAFHESYSTHKKEFKPTDYKCIEKLNDIEKALNYLDCGRTVYPDIASRMKMAESTGQSSKIPCRFFNLTFYKKGTCHIEFTNEELLKKFNIFGSRMKGWLPQTYGKTAYSEMTEEEKNVIDEFEGKESYEKVFENKDFFIYNPEEDVLKIEMCA